MSADAIDRLATRLHGLYSDLSVKLVQDERSDIELLLIAQSNRVEAIGRHIYSASESSPAIKARKVAALLTERAAEMRRLAQSLDRQFSLFIMGMGNSGKSTLLNALAQSNLAEMDYLPKTWKIDVFSASTSHEATLIYRDGRSTAVRVADAKRIIAEEEGKAARADQRVQQEYAKASYATPAEKAEGMTYLRTKYGYVSDVSEVIWPCTPKGLLKTFQLVDTPGLAQDRKSLSDGRTTVRDYYRKADGVVWLFDAHRTSGKAAYEALAEADRLVGGLDRSMIGIVNYRGGLADQDLRRIVADVDERYGHMLCAVVPVNVKMAYAASLDEDEQLLSESGHRSLSVAIDFHFTTKSRELQHSRVVSHYRWLDEDSVSIIKEYYNRIIYDRDNFNKAVQDLGSILKTNYERSQRQLTAMVSNHSFVVKKNIEERSALVFDLDSLARDTFIRKDILNADYLSSQIAAERSRLTERLRESADSLVRQVNFTDYKHLNIMDLVMPSQDQEWTVFNEHLEHAVSKYGRIWDSLFLSGLFSFFEGLGLGGLSKFFGLGQLKYKLKTFYEQYCEQVRAAADKEFLGLQQIVMTHATTILARSFASTHCPIDKVDTVAGFLSRMAPADYNQASVRERILRRLTSSAD